MWKPLELDMIPGRVRAVSAPDERQMMLVWTTDGLFGVWFSRSATLLRMAGPAEAEKAFDAGRGVLTWQDVSFAMHGERQPAAARPGSTLAESTPQGDRLAFDPAGRLVGIDSAEGTRIPIDDPPRAGKWFAAGFSPDGRYLLVADEWNVRLFRYEPPKGQERARKRPPEQAALLHAIATEPDDDNARLVYADWLAENGQSERGEFIRLQCAHARCLRAGRLFADEGREQELLYRNGELWEADYPSIRGVRWSGFWRGFPGVTVTSATTLAQYAATIWEASPVESVVIEKLDLKGVTEFVKRPQLSRLRILEVRNWRPSRANNEPLRLLFRSPEISRLWWLAFHNSRLDPGAVELIAASEVIPNLEFLTLRWCEIGDDGARALAASPNLNKLWNLDLTGNEFTGDSPSILRKRFPGVQF